MCFFLSFLIYCFWYFISCVARLSTNKSTKELQTGFVKILWNLIRNSRFILCNLSSMMMIYIFEFCNLFEEIMRVQSYVKETNKSYIRLNVKKRKRISSKKHEEIEKIKWKKRPRSTGYFINMRVSKISTIKYLVRIYIFHFYFLCHNGLKFIFLLSQVDPF